jgi:hypothetical protein
LHEFQHIHLFPICVLHRQPTHTPFECLLLSDLPLETQVSKVDFSLNINVNIPSV